MKIAISANQEDAKLLKKLILNYCTVCNCYPNIEHFENRERIIEAMMKTSYEIVVVAIDKAKGMEAVKHIQLRDPKTQIIWFSNDKDFAGFAFEKGVRQFALQPISKEKLEEGLRRCGVVPKKTNLCRVHLKG
jgi:two-component SAPR family response regulator